MKFSSQISTRSFTCQNKIRSRCSKECNLRFNIRPLVPDLYRKHSHKFQIKRMQGARISIIKVK